MTRPTPKIRPHTMAITASPQSSKEARSKPAAAKRSCRSREPALVLQRPPVKSEAVPDLAPRPARARRAPGRRPSRLRSTGTRGRWTRPGRGHESRRDSPARSRIESFLVEGLARRRVRVHSRHTGHARVEGPRGFRGLVPRRRYWAHTRSSRTRSRSVISPVPSAPQGVHLHGHVVPVGQAQLETSAGDDAPRTRQLTGERAQESVLPACVPPETRDRQSNADGCRQKSRIAAGHHKRGHQVTSRVRAR